ncbi:MAG: hypothetical protein Q8M19_00790 [Reyranella sp.]|nr:hypothetical protein [Reyranella sp.]
MSDYNPDPRYGSDRYGTHNRYDYNLEPTGSGERSSYALVGLLAVFALIGGLMFFSGPPAHQQQAQQPAPTTTE